MRLLNIHTRQFRSFEEHTIPTYAIASHRWGRHEATHEDVRYQRRVAGCQKVWNYCKAVNSLNSIVLHSAPWRAMGYDLKCDWIWIDTACIDKTDNAEISESINSMYRWYRGAAVCYAYLQDVRSAVDYPGAMLDFMRSEWFTRGWTLQELLAPGVVVFMTVDWKVLGHKCPYDKPLCELVCRGFGPRLDFIVSRITGIPLAVIRNSTNASTTSIEERLNWITRRVTTKAEDRAYCMLGICNIFMPVIYGEGDYAWTRLLATLKEQEKNRNARRLSWSNVDKVTEARAFTVLTSHVQQDQHSGQSDGQQDDSPIHVKPAQPGVNPLRRTDAGQRHRQQVLWDATLAANIIPRGKTSALVTNQHLVQTLPQTQSHSRYWLWNGAYGNGLGLIATPVSARLEIEPHQLGHWLQPHFLGAGEVLQCGYCHGNIYTQATTKCTGPYCREPIFHKRCSDWQMCEEHEWCCPKCRSGSSDFLNIDEPPPPPPPSPPPSPIPVVALSEPVHPEGVLQSLPESQLEEADLESSVEDSSCSKSDLPAELDASSPEMSEDSDLSEDKDISLTTPHSDKDRATIRLSFRFRSLLRSQHTDLDKKGARPSESLVSGGTGLGKLRGYVTVRRSGKANH